MPKPQPSVPPALDKLLDRGRGYLQAGDHSAAHALAERMMKEHPDLPEPLLFAGEVAFFRRNFTGSEAFAARCCEQHPGEVGGHVLRCRALLGLGRQGEARDVALEAAKMQVVDDHHQEILVNVLNGCLVPEASYALCRSAVENDPYNARAHRRLALTCRLIGRLDEAREAADIALRFDAHDYEMIGLRSAVHTATADDNNIARLDAMLRSGCRNAVGAARVAFALAKELEELGEFERAFEALRQGAEIKRSTVNYNLDADLESFELLASTYTPDVVASAPAGFDSREPVFVLGLPRTGSTLVDRILSSHSDVYSAGELTHFDAAMMGQIRTLGPLANRADLVARSTQIDPARVGEDYLQRTRPFTGATARFIDKRPLNFISLGVIHAALPRATVIHVRRSPLDTCYAIYKFLFNQGYPWSYDLGDIARYYVGYRRLMDHWRAVLPQGRIVDVAYEDVVGDLEREARRLLDAVELPWQPAVLEFQENPSVAMTGSAAQVRKKLYTSSIGLWKRYEAQLQPVARALEKAGIDPYAP